MFTVAVLAKEKHKHIAQSFGFVKCICGSTFAFDFETRENCRKADKAMALVCPECKHESNEVVVPCYTDPKGVQHGSMKYKLVYLGKCNLTT